MWDGSTKAGFKNQKVIIEFVSQLGGKIRAEARVLGFDGDVILLEHLRHGRYVGFQVRLVNILSIEKLPRPAKHY